MLKGVCMAKGGILLGTLVPWPRGDAHISRANEMRVCRDITTLWGMQRYHHPMGYSALKNRFLGRQGSKLRFFPGSPIASSLAS